jgi:hypothetical protein
MTCTTPELTTNGDILFELPHIHHPLGHFKQLQSMNIKYDGHGWCKL